MIIKFQPHQCIAKLTLINKRTISADKIMHLILTYTAEHLPLIANRTRTDHAFRLFYIRKLFRTCFTDQFSLLCKNSLAQRAAPRKQQVRQIFCRLTHPYADPPVPSCPVRTFNVIPAGSAISAVSALTFVFSVFPVFSFCHPVNSGLSRPPVVDISLFTFYSGVRPDAEFISFLSPASACFRRSASVVYRRCSEVLSIICFRTSGLPTITTQLFARVMAV